MLQLGLNDNLKLSKISVVDFTGKKDDTKSYKALEFIFSNKTGLSHVDMLMSSDEIDTSSDDKVLYFFPSAPMNVSFNGTELSLSQKVDMVINDISEFKNILLSLCRCYTTDVIPFGNIFRGTDIDIKDKNDFNIKIINSTYIYKVVDNMCNVVIDYIKPLLDTKRIRIFLVRSNKNKGSYGLRRKGLSINPCIESCDINPTKLKFTNYEIANGFDIPIKADIKIGVSDITSIDTNNSINDFDI